MTPGPAAGPAVGERDRPLLRLRGLPAPLRRQRARPARCGRPRPRHRRLLDRRHACGGGPPRRVRPARRGPAPPREPGPHRHVQRRPRLGRRRLRGVGVGRRHGDPGCLRPRHHDHEQRPGRGPRLRPAAPRPVRPTRADAHRAVAGDHVLGRPALDRPAMPHGLQLHLVARGGRAHVGAPRRRRLRPRAPALGRPRAAGCASPRCPTSPTSGGCRRRSTACTRAACCAAATPTPSSTCATARLHSTRTSPAAASARRPATAGRSGGHWPARLSGRRAGPSTVAASTRSTWPPWSPSPTRRAPTPAGCAQWHGLRARQALGAGRSQWFPPLLVSGAAHRARNEVGNLRWKLRGI